MADSPLIFVSHSSKDNQLTKELCAALATPADASQPSYSPAVDFEILVDYDALVAGQEWPKQLHEWMARCQAAVILLTTNAVASPWVLKEATILAWRKSVQESFHLFTVRCPGVTNQMLKDARFDPLALGQVQQVAQSTPDEIAQTVRASLGTPALDSTPFDDLVDSLADLFLKVGPHTLERVANQIQVSKPSWVPGQDERAQYVRAIARQLVNGSLGRLGGASELIKLLSSTVSRETVKQILYIAAPYWVDAEAAGRLPPLTVADPRRAAAMNGVEVGEYTSRMYLLRAHPLSREFAVIPTAGGAAGDWVRHYTDEICNFIRRRRNSDQDNDAIIERLSKGKPSFYVVLPSPIPDSKSLHELMDRFPKLTFILWTGERLERDESLERTVWLEPEVDLDLEQEQFSDWIAAEDILLNMAE